MSSSPNPNKVWELQMDKQIKEYEKYNKAYYDKNNPLVSDSKFDELKENIIKLEKKYDFLENQNSPSKVVGFKPSKNFEKFSPIMYGS